MEKDKFAHLKHRLPGIKTLAMLKMEKNFIAVIERKYPRQPYEASLYSFQGLVNHIQKEMKELQDACDHADFLGMKEECADISNLVDYLFEKLAKQKEGT